MVCVSFRAYGLRWSITAYDVRLSTETEVSLQKCNYMQIMVFPVVVTDQTDAEKEWRVAHWMMYARASTRVRHHESSGQWVFQFFPSLYVFQQSALVTIQKPTASHSAELSSVARWVPGHRSDSRGLHLLLQPCILFLLHPCSLHKPKDHLEGCLQLCCLHVNSPNHFTLPLNLSFVSLFLPFIHSPLFFNFFFPQTLPLNHLYSAWTLLASSTGLRTHRNLTLWEIPSVI